MAARNKKPMIVAGIISGTSIDGVSFSICKISHESHKIDHTTFSPTIQGLQVETLTSKCVNWPPSLRRLLLFLADPTQELSKWDACDSKTMKNDPHGIERRSEIALESLKVSLKNMTSCICEANFLVSEYFSHVLIEEESAADVKIDLVGSHGQTIWHQQNPLFSQQDVRIGKAHIGKISSTFQIGDMSVIASRTGATCIGNFRTADIAESGQGAPLTSTIDCLLISQMLKEISIQDFPNEDIQNEWIALQNIGGMGNATLIPTSNSTRSREPIAFDTGPGNVLLDWHMMTYQNKPYDEGGSFAANGKTVPDLLKIMLQHEYFSLPIPKTCGREQFTADLGKKWKVLSEKQFGMLGTNSATDFQSTLTDLTAASIAFSYLHSINYIPSVVLVHGGGSHNKTLMERLESWLFKLKNPTQSIIDLELSIFGEKHSKLSKNILSSPSLKPVKVISSDAIGISSDAKESILFALLAYLAIHNIPSNIPSCTGAHSRTVLGQIAPGKNFFQLISQTISHPD